MEKQQGNEYLVVFPSQNQAIFLYNELIKRGLEVKITSAPCTLTNSCSKCIRFNEKYMELILEEINNNKIKIKGIYKVIKDYTDKVKYVLVKGSDS